MSDLLPLLVKTSRTFALAIPLLPVPTQKEVTIAYLLFRIADTFEDAADWPPELQQKALDDFSRVLEASDEGDVRRLARTWVAERPIEHEGYLELLEESPAVIAALRELRTEAQEIICRHVRRTAAGMSRFAGRSRMGEDLRLGSLAELRDYCYVVAGIVGEMLTELFVLGREGLEDTLPYLRARARFFGEGLQLTNILKDTAFDVSEGRSYVPETAERTRVFDLAREDLRRAEEYVLALQDAGAPRGLVAFNALPVLLAWKTLDRVEAEGSGAKLTRPEVAAIFQQMDEALDAGEPAVAVGPGHSAV